jgi:hypothetical protein
VEEKGVLREGEREGERVRGGGGSSRHILRTGDTGSPVLAVMN